MERIEALIEKLREQSAQNADPNVLLGTVQLLQFELTRLRSAAPQRLGTAKVSVVLPAQAMNEDYSRYAPRPAAAVAAPKEEEQVKAVLPEGKEVKEVKEVKEKVLVDNGSISVVQKNGQLDMVFDPMAEIPTLSQQTRPGTAEAKTGADNASINDKLRQGRTELIEVLKETPVKDLRKAIGINDRFLFINDLFRGDETMYERSIKTINNFSIFAEAEYWINRELQVKLGWPAEHPSVDHFLQLVRRRFS